MYYNYHVRLHKQPLNKHMILEVAILSVYCIGTVHTVSIWI